MKIYHRVTGAVLFETESDTLIGANLSGANLSRASLIGANLSSADLSSANLSSANLDGETLKQTPVGITGLYWWVMVTDVYLTIGCQRHTHAEWAAFDDATIATMDRQALRFWRQWREPLLTMCAAHATKVED